MLLTCVQSEQDPKWTAFTAGGSRHMVPCGTMFVADSVTCAGNHLINWFSCGVTTIPRNVSYTVGAE